MNNRLKEILRFVFTGGTCALIEYAALYALKTWLHWDVLIATPVAFLISVCVNYVMCVKWVFSGAKEGSRAAQLGFVITSGMGFFLNWGLMWVLTTLFGEDVALITLLDFTLRVWMVNKVIATGIVMVWNYFTKRWLLKGDAT